jgi:hypothetical protein
MVLVDEDWYLVVFPQISVFRFNIVHGRRVESCVILFDG